MKALLLTALLLPTLAALIFLISSCQIGYPFNGPGYDAKRQVIRDPHQGMVIVAVTEGIVERGKGDAFSEQLGRVLDAIPTSDGLIGYSVRKEVFGRKVWTMSAWTDETALDRFIYSKAHKEAMRSGGIPRDTVRSGVTKIAAADVPLTWKRVREIIKQQNSPS